MSPASEYLAQGDFVTELTQLTTRKDDGVLPRPCGGRHAFYRGDLSVPK